MSSPSSACIRVWFLYLPSCQRQRLSWSNVTQFVACHIAALHPRLPFTVACFSPTSPQFQANSSLSPVSLKHLSSQYLLFLPQPTATKPCIKSTFSSIPNTHSRIPAFDYLCIYSPGGIYLAQKRIFMGRTGVANNARDKKKTESVVSNTLPYRTSTIKNYQKSHFFCLQTYPKSRS
jgi:hypothetical protein